MIRKMFATALLASGAMFAALPTQAQETFDAKQTEAVRKIVRDYLMEHPEVIGEAIESLREKMRAQAEVEAKKAIESRKDEIFNDANDPVLGNAKGDVVLVEFFDYNCPYCKVVLDPMMDAVKADKNVKLVLKEMPILSEDSTTAARAALAAKKLGKYEEVHRALMKFRGKLDEKTIFRLIGEAGVNVDQIKKEMMAPEIDKQIKKNLELAHSLDVSSTPSFIVAGADGKAARALSGALEGQVFGQLFKITRSGGRLTGAN